MNEYNKTETVYREQASGYQWGESWEEGQDKERGFRGIK